MWKEPEDRIGEIFELLEWKGPDKELEDFSEVREDKQGVPWFMNKGSEYIFGKILKGYSWIMLILSMHLCSIILMDRFNSNDFYSFVIIYHMMKIHFNMSNHSEFIIGSL